MVCHWVYSLGVLVIVSWKAIKDQGPDVASRHDERREKAEEARFASEGLDTDWELRLFAMWSCRFTVFCKLCLMKSRQEMGDIIKCCEIQMTYTHRMQNCALLLCIYLFFPGLGCHFTKDLEMEDLISSAAQHFVAPELLCLDLNISLGTSLEPLQILSWWICSFWGSHWRSFHVVSLQSWWDDCSCIASGFGIL